MEEPETAVLREIEEETGYRAGHLEPMVEYLPLAGISTQHYWTYVASEPQYIQDAIGNETTRVEWIPIREVPKLIRAGQVTDGPSLLMLSYFFGRHNP